MASSLPVPNRTIQQANLLPPEIMGIVFEHLGPTNSSPSEFEPDVKKALRSCLVASTYSREFALRRLFLSVRINIYVSSVSNLDLLLEILCPSSPRIRWMSVLPYVRHFKLRIWRHRNKRYDLAEPCLLRLLSVLSGDQAHPLTSLALSIQTCHSRGCCLITKELQAALGSLVKTPHLQSLEIGGISFLSPDFFYGTNICQLDVSSYNPYFYAHNPHELLWSHPPDEEMRNDFRVRSLTTDTSFPFRLKSLAAESLLESLDHLNICINDDNERTYRKVADMLRLTVSLKSLTLRYSEVYSETTPIGDWDTNFGEMQALETLEILIGMGYINDSPDTDFNYLVPIGMAALGLLFAALNTIHQPMPRLARIGWCYSLGTAISEDLPFLLLERWLRTDANWGTLDGKLISYLFPVLSAVQLEFHIPRLSLYQTDDEGNIHLLANSDAEIATRVHHLREEVFPRSVAALRENFELSVTC